MSSADQVWVVDDNQSIRWVLEKALQKADYAVKTFADAEQALSALQRARPRVLISDVRMPGMSGIELLEQIQELAPDLPVIIITAHSDLDSAVSAFSSGAFEYLPKPFDLDEVVEQVGRAIRQQSTTPADTKDIIRDKLEIIGEAPAMQEVFRTIGRLSQSNITILINGESGTGKELVASALHRHSQRAENTFIALNMAAIPKDLMDSELFGHEKGAFTGAQSRRKGRFEQADKGTLFLDEIGDMPEQTQTRLLRVLEDGQFYRVGGTESVKVDVRIIAATHQNLEALVKEGRFREDLFHRINVIKIKIPPLRERWEDIPLLLEHSLRKSAKELGVEKKTVTPAALEILTAFSWPGNVRQLENTALRLTVMASGNEIRPEDLPSDFLETPKSAPSGLDWQTQLAHWGQQRLKAGQTPLLEEATARFERTMIEIALAETGGRKQEAAMLLGWGRNTLTRKIKELGLTL